MSDVHKLKKMLQDMPMNPALLQEIKKLQDMGLFKSQKKEKRVHNLAGAKTNQDDDDHDDDQDEDHDVQDDDQGDDNDVDDNGFPGFVAKDLVSDFHQDLQNYLDSFKERSMKSEAKAEEYLMVNALHGAMKKYKDESDKTSKLEQEIEVMTKKMQELESKLQDQNKDDDDDVSKPVITAEEAEKKEKKRKANKLAEIRNKLKDGKLSREMYTFLKDECDTKTTKANIIKAFNIYKEMHGKEPDCNLTFANMLKDMERILSI